LGIEADHNSSTAYVPSLWNKIAGSVAEAPEIVAAITYGDASDQKTLGNAQIPVLQQLAGGELTTRQRTTDILSTYYYPDVQTFEFATPFSKSFHYNTEALSHTRNLTFLKPIMGGPYFDLETIWDEHTYYEFSDRSVEHTMSTMVQEPYVNHVPTVRRSQILWDKCTNVRCQMTGGVGRTALTSFYRQNFIFLNSVDTSMELLSRTIGIDRIIDEFLFKFTHDKELDWL